MKLNDNGRFKEFIPLDQAAHQPHRILSAVISCEASTIALTHNHPDGDVTPSPEELKMTAKLTRELFKNGLKILDHIIISRNDSFSFDEADMMPSPTKSRAGWRR